MPFRPSRFVPVFLLVTASVCVQGTVDEPLNGDRLGALITDLDDEAFDVRERASEALASDTSVTLLQIEARLAEGGLSPEQMARLEHAAISRFSERPRGGLGVRFGGRRTASGGVMIGEVLDGFPAAGLLQAGDTVVAIEGRPVRSNDEMSFAILSHNPGEIIRIMVDRRVIRAPGLMNPDAPPVSVQRLTVDVPLGSFSDLGPEATLPAERLEAAYRYRVSRLRAGERAHTEIGAGFTPLGWLASEGYAHDPVAVPYGTFEPSSPWRFLAFGGQPETWTTRVEMNRGDPHAASQRAAAGLRTRDADPVCEAVSGYRVLLQRIDEIDRMLVVAGDPSNPRFDAVRASRLTEERAKLLGEITEFTDELGTLDLPTITLPPMR